MKKYYIEVYPKIKNNIQEFSNSIYIIQSNFYDTIREAEEWADKICYLNNNFGVSVMYAEGTMDSTGYFEYDDIGTEKKYVRNKKEHIGIVSSGWTISGYDEHDKLIISFFTEKSRRKAMKIYDDIGYSEVRFNLIENLD